jgi:hypothetical protein
MWIQAQSKQMLLEEISLGFTRTPVMDL